MVDFLMAMFPILQVFKEENNRKLWNPAVSYGVEKLTREDQSSRRATNYFMKSTLIQYIENINGAVQRAKQKAGLYTLPECNCTMLNLVADKKDGALILK